jgi:putative tricarboxylic transport membrane protein
MDTKLAPFMQRNPIWPSTFPKALSVLAIIALLIILSGVEKSEPKEAEIDYRRLHQYKLGQAVTLLGLMVAYALLLRPAGFIFSTSAFLFLGSFILGERKWVLMTCVAVVATMIVWHLMQEVLGIYMRPLPGFLPPN